MIIDIRSWTILTLKVSFSSSIRSTKVTHRESWMTRDWFYTNNYAVCGQGFSLESVRPLLNNLAGWVIPSFKGFTKISHKKSVNLCGFMSIWPWLHNLKQDQACWVILYLLWMHSKYSKILSPIAQRIRIFDWWWDILVSRCPLAPSVKGRAFFWDRVNTSFQVIWIYRLSKQMGATTKIWSVNWAVS